MKIKFLNRVHLKFFQKECYKYKFGGYHANYQKKKPLLQFSLGDATDLYHGQGSNIKKYVPYDSVQTKPSSFPYLLHGILCYSRGTPLFIYFKATNKVLILFLLFIYL